MNSVLLYNHAGCENRGCEAIVRTTAEILRARGVQRTMLASGQAEYDRRLSIPGIDGILRPEISPFSARRLINSVGFRLGMPREHEVARRWSPVIRAGRRSGVCFSVGGDTYCYAYQEHMRVINRRLKRAGARLVLWGASVDPERLSGDTLEDLSDYDLIAARESISWQAMREKGLNAVLWRDPAFQLKAETPEWDALSSLREPVGLNVSPLVLDRMGDRGEGVRLFTEVIRHVLRTTASDVVLFSHVTWPHDNDAEVVRALKAAFADEPRVAAAPEGLSAPETKGLIAGLSLLVTARTHASIAGYSSFVPTLVIGYSVKAIGIARDLYGTEAGHVLPAQDLRTPGQASCAFDALRAREGEERAFLRARVPAYLAERDGALESVFALQ